MSVYNIREKFSYTITSNSISYVRNYNFNSTTISDIPLSMSNSDGSIPITVNITTTDPWVQVVDPLSGANLKYPNGNVVLQPTSSKLVLVKLNLPPEIESIPETTVIPRINLDIKSGSFPIFLPPTGPNSTNKNVIIPESDIYYINVGERAEINLTVFDVNGTPDFFSVVEWRSNNNLIVQVEEPTNTQVYYSPSYPRNIVGIQPGETTVTVSTDNDRTADIKVIVREGPITTSTSLGGDGGNNQFGLT